MLSNQWERRRQILRLIRLGENEFRLGHHRYMRSPRKIVETASNGISLLAQLRDVSEFSSRNTTKGALLNEAFLIFKALRENAATVAELRENALRGQSFPRASYENRQRIWDCIHYRYFAPGIASVAAGLAAATASGVGSPAFVSLAYLYFSLRDHLTFDLVTRLLWERWCARSLIISVGDVLEFLDVQSSEHPVVKKWSPSTRTKLAQSILAALRDFGVLRGRYNKQIQRPAASPETVFQLLCVLLSEGHHGRAVIEAPDWRLFLWSEDDAAKALADLAQRRWIRFERGGRTVILELIRTSEVGA